MPTSIQLPPGRRRVNTMRRLEEISVFLAGVSVAVRGQLLNFQDNFFLGGCPGVDVAQNFSLEMVRSTEMSGKWGLRLREPRLLAPCDRAL